MKTTLIIKKTKQIPGNLKNNSSVERNEMQKSAVNNIKVYVRKFAGIHKSFKSNEKIKKSDSKINQTRRSEYPNASPDLSLITSLISHN